MNSQENWVEELKKDVVIPAAVRQKAKAGYEMIRKQAATENASLNTAPKSKKKWTAKKIAVCIAAAVLACTTLTVAAVAIVRWNENFAKQYKVSEELQNKLSKKGVTELIDKEQTVDGITVKAVQAIADGQYAYVMFEVKGDKEIPLDKGVQFGDTITEVKDGNGVGGTYGFSSEKGANGEAIYEFFLMSDDEQGMLGKEVMIILNDLVVDGATIYEKSLYHKGTWEFSITLPESDASRVYEVYKELPQYGVKIVKVRLSPISYTFYYEGWPNMDEELKVRRENGEDIPEYPYREAVQALGLAMKDGGAKYFYRMLGSTHKKITKEGINDRYAVSMGFCEIVDADAVEGVLFGQWPDGEYWDESVGSIPFVREDMTEVKLNP